MSAEDTVSDECRRAAQAAIEVVNEECKDADIEVREVETGVFMEMPQQVAESVDEIDDGEVSLGEFANFVDDSPFVRDWLGGIIGSREADINANREAFAAEVATLASTIFDQPFAFTPKELRGTPTLGVIAESAKESRNEE